jgi:hypothetical protein
VLQVLRARGYRTGLISNQAAGTTVEGGITRLRGLGSAARSRTRW